MGRELCNVCLCNMLHGETQHVQWIYPTLPCVALQPFDWMKETLGLKEAKPAEH